MPDKELIKVFREYKLQVGPMESVVVKKLYIKKLESFLKNN
jgi:hypothetical protein